MKYNHEEMDYKPSEIRPPAKWEVKYCPWIGLLALLLALLVYGLGERDTALITGGLGLLLLIYPRLH
jgi:hypothetical protein